MGGINGDFIPAGAVKPSSIENDTYDAGVGAYRLVEIPSNLQMRVDYNSQTDGQPLYVGYGARGLASSANGWLVQKFTYDSNSPRQCTLRQIAYGIWDNRASLTYA